MESLLAFQEACWLEYYGTDMGWNALLVVW